MLRKALMEGAIVTEKRKKRIFKVTEIELFSRILFGNITKFIKDLKLFLG